MPRCGDPRCSCAGGWAGLISAEAADTARVVDLDLQREGLLAAFADALFGIEGHGSDPDQADRADPPCPEWVAELVDQHLDLARSHPLDALISLADGQPVATPLPLGLNPVPPAIGAVGSEWRTDDSPRLGCVPQSK